MKLRKDLTGLKFGRLKVIDVAFKCGRGHYSWNCECDCGHNTVKQSRHLLNGASKSCGCLQKELQSKKMTTHGLTKNKKTPPYYSAWGSIISRCYNPKDPAFKDYGGRGIKMSSDWRYDFTKFISDIGERPSKKHTIDRINNDGNYEKSNFRWATMAEQCKNRRNSHFLTFNGRTMILSDWALELGSFPGNILKMLKNRTFEEIVKFYETK